MITREEMQAWIDKTCRDNGIIDRDRLTKLLELYAQDLTSEDWWTLQGQIVYKPQNEVKPMTKGLEG